MSDSLMTCRVCGFRFDDFYPWGEAGNSSSFDFCTCCGIEFGYGDVILTAIRDSRDKWIKNGAKWNEPEKRPKDWSLERQLRNIPDEFK